MDTAALIATACVPLPLTVQLFAQHERFLKQIKYNRDFILNLVDELDYVRSEWKLTQERCKQLEHRCRLLENSLIMEKKELLRVVEENHNLTQNLPTKSTAEEQEENLVANQSRKRSIDFLTEDSDDTLMPRRKLRRSSSVPSSGSIPSSTPSTRGNYHLTSSLQDTRLKRRSLGSSDESPSDLLVSRQHNFNSKRNLLSGVVCEHCKQSIRYCILFVKCAACKLSYHETCSRRLEMPCLPRLITPKRDNSNLKALRLADYCPDTPPMIPHLIVHSVMHLEKVLCDVVIYETLGDEQAAAKLLMEFKTQRNIPDLTARNNATVAGCIMMFLMQIRDPLIPPTSRTEFFAADNQEELLDVINSLPTTHRDTLVYLVIHWKRLSEWNISGNLTIKSLCKTLGPIIFGTARSPLSNATDETLQIEKSRVILEHILKLPYDTLKQLISQEDGSTIGSTPLSRTSSDSRKNRPLIIIPSVKAT